MTPANESRRSTVNAPIPRRRCSGFDSY